MFKLEKLKDKAVLTIYGYVGGVYMDFRAINDAISDITKSGYKKLDFRMHTYGGGVFDGNLIYNFIAGFDGEIDIYIDGVAASMGSILAMSGTRCYIAENGFVMIHSPKGSGDGTAKDFENYAALLRKMEANFKKKLVEKTGKSEEEVNAWFDGSDHWFDADDCVSMKIVDGKFNAKVKNIKTLDKSEASQIGAKATYDRFAASLIDLTNTNIISDEMNKEDLIKRYGLTGLTAESTDEQVLAAVDAKINAAAEEAKKANKKAIEAAVKANVDSKKITKEQTEKYVAIGEKIGLEDLNALFADMKVYEPITPKITGKTEGGKTPEDRTGWTWDDYQAKASAELEAMPKTDADTFKALYKAKYDVEPEL